MSRIKSLLSLCCLLLLAAGAFAPSASAASPSQQECEKNGGTFDRNQGTVTCTFVTTTPPGNAPETSNARRVTKTEGTSGQGNIDNKSQPTTPTCEGPPGQCK